MYITNYSLNKLLYSITAEENDVEALKDLFNDFDANHLPKYLTQFFNTHELKRLSAVMQLLNSTALKEPIKITLLKKVKTEDTGRYVQKPKPPSYHLTANCPYLSKNWRGVIIPSQLHKFAKEQEDPQALIDKYRSYFPEYIDERTDLIAPTITANAYFLEKYNLHLPKPDEEQRTNSESTELYQTDYKAQINRCVDEILAITEGQDEISKQCYKMRFMSSYVIRRIVNQTKYQAQAERLATLKEDLFKNLISYLQVITKFDQESFDANLLRKLGFKGCTACTGERHNDRLF